MTWYWEIQCNPPINSAECLPKWPTFSTKLNLHAEGENCHVKGTLLVASRGFKSSFMWCHEYSVVPVWYFPVCFPYFVIWNLQKCTHLKVVSGGVRSEGFEVLGKFVASGSEMLWESLYHYVLPVLLHMMAVVFHNKSHWRCINWTRAQQVWLFFKS